MVGNAAVLATASTFALAVIADKDLRDVLWTPRLTKSCQTSTAQTTNVQSVSLGSCHRFGLIRTAMRQRIRYYVQHGLPEQARLLRFGGWLSV